MPVSAEPRRLGQLLASPIKWAPNYRAEKVLRRLRLARPSLSKKFATYQALWPCLLMRWPGRCWACGWRRYAKKLKEQAIAPRLSNPTKWNVFLPRSIPIVVMVCGVA